MGTENSGGTVVAYLDGQPIEIRGPLPEFTIYDISEDMKTAREILEVWVDIRITMEVAAEGKNCCVSPAPWPWRPGARP